ncbi:endonuclease V [Aquimarina aquimarini]|uniref:endonuclease V n=1 Tax=Aquimarina aquimarini TaxID=1191734 RepID=UPI00210143F1|nr:endonuclease V [Aquimarina aquimarini]
MENLLHMILAFDTYYFDNKAKTVCISFSSWADTQPIEIYSEIIEEIADYEPGAFYKRELPCIISLLKKINLKKIDLIIVDSFVFLDDFDKPGLGAYLFESLKSKTPIIGVAKSGFYKNIKNVRHLLRGESKKPLYISAIGIDLDTAYHHIQSMHGNYRNPTLLQLLDTKTKEKENT